MFDEAINQTGPEIDAEAWRANMKFQAECRRKGLDPVAELKRREAATLTEVEAWLTAHKPKAKERAKLDRGEAQPAGVVSNKP